MSASGELGLLSCARLLAILSPGLDRFLEKLKSYLSLFPGSPSTGVGEPLATTRTAASSTLAGGSGSAG